jgi:CBS domain-containing protein
MGCSLASLKTLLKEKSRMDAKPAPKTDADDSQPPESIVELFHMVESLIPARQRVLTVAPDTSVGEAIGKMKEQNFSQLPVVSGNAVLGVFSYRSLAHTLLQLGPIDTDFSTLPVDEFMEVFTFVQPIDKWESILEILNRADAVLVGNRNNLRGILTSMDVLTYLHRLANPFVMLAEIELSLRQIIEACVSTEELQACAINSLSAKYAVEEMPASPSAMTFNDYVQVIGDGRNWPHFQPAFGSGGWMRRQTVSRLTEVRDLRNDTFHFKRQLGDDDYATLARHRDWLEMKTRAFEGRKEPPAELDPTPAPSVPVKPKTNQDAMLASVNPEAVPFIRWLLDEAVAHNLITTWRATGFTLRLQLPGRVASFAYVDMPGTFQIYLHNALRLSKAEALQWRQELMAFGILQPKGAKTFQAEIDAANTPVLQELFAHLLGSVAALARYPLEIHATVDAKTIVAELLDESGRVLFEGTEFGSVSGAAKAGWLSANGWTFWQYYNERAREWRPIDELRKH